MKIVEPTESLKPEILGSNPQGVAPGMEGLEWLAWLMDRAFKVPGTPIRVGLDAVLGLLPIGGDFMTGLIQAGIVLVAMTRYKVPKPIAARMTANVLLDIIVGSIPFVGDAFDVYFKANTRNLTLLREVAEQRIQHKPVATAPSVLYLLGIGAAFFTILALILIGFIAAVSWLIHQF